MVMVSNLFKNRKSSSFALFIVMQIFFISSPLQANYDLGLYIGPPTVGGGGSNPISIPPANPVEFELILTTPNKWRYHLGLVPILLGFGKLFELNSNFYIGFGSALLTSMNGIGPGLYSSFGIRTPFYFEHLAFDLNYTQAVGFSVTSNHFISPFSVRAGMTWRF